MIKLPNELMSANGDCLVNPVFVKELSNTIIVNCRGRLELVPKIQISKPAKKQVMELNKRIILAYLKDNRLSKKDAAIKIGVNYQTFTKISNGEMLPSKRMIDLFHGAKCMVKREIK